MTFRKESPPALFQCSYSPPPPLFFAGHYKIFPCPINFSSTKVNLGWGGVEKITGFKGILCKHKEMLGDGTRIKEFKGMI